MNALTRVEQLDQLFPEMFRRFAQPSRWAQSTPGNPA